jgi:hypothetical protein
MNQAKLPKRVFNSPLVRYANFENGSFVNLIRLIKPYANGNTYAISETTELHLNSSGLFKTYKKARKAFDMLVNLQKEMTDLVKEEEITENL